MKSKPLKSEKDRKAACLARQNSETLKSPCKPKEAADNKMVITTPEATLKLIHKSASTCQPILTDSKPLQPDEFQSLMRPTSTFEQQSSEKSVSR